MPRHIVCLTVEFAGEANAPAAGAAALAHGALDLVGARRLLDLLRAQAIRTTWFIPGVTIENHPDACEAILAGGHEIAQQGWAGAASVGMSRAAQVDDFGRADAAIRKLAGRSACGFRAPAAALSDSILELLLGRGLLYDSSLPGADYWPYRARTGISALPGRLIERGRETDLIEMPVTCRIAAAPAAAMTAADARAAAAEWRDEFDYMRHSVNWGVLTCALAPWRIGRGAVLPAIADVLRDLAEAGAAFMTLEDAARECRARFWEEVPGRDPGGRDDP